MPLILFSVFFFSCVLPCPDRRRRAVVQQHYNLRPATFRTTARVIVVITLSLFKSLPRPPHCAGDCLALLAFPWSGHYNADACTWYCHSRARTGQPMTYGHWRWSTASWPRFFSEEETSSLRGLRLISRRERWPRKKQKKLRTRFARCVPRRHRLLLICCFRRRFTSGHEFASVPPSASWLSISGVNNKRGNNITARWLEIRKHSWLIRYTYPDSAVQRI